MLTTADGVQTRTRDEKIMSLEREIVLGLYEAFSVILAILSQLCSLRKKKCGKVTAVE